MTREEFYRQNKDACRKFQGRKTSFNVAELNEWVLPFIRDLKNDKTFSAIDILKNPVAELTLDKMSENDRKIYEDNDIVPFQKNFFSSPHDLPPAILKQMTDRNRTAQKNS